MQQESNTNISGTYKGVLKRDLINGITANTTAALTYNDEQDWHVCETREMPYSPNIEVAIMDSDISLTTNPTLIFGKTYLEEANPLAIKQVVNSFSLFKARMRAENLRFISEMRRYFNQEWDKKDTKRYFGNELGLVECHFCGAETLFVLDDYVCCKTCRYESIAYKEDGKQAFDVFQKPLQTEKQQVKSLDTGSLLRKKRKRDDIFINDDYSDEDEEDNYDLI